MASKLGKVIANFEVQLSTKLAIGGTTATLSSVLDKAGNTIPNGRYFLTIDPDNSKKEHFSCTVTGTSVTALKTLNLTTTAETSGALREHKVGAKVIITDFAVLAKVQQILDGVETLNASAPLYYDAVPTLTAPEQLATVQYVLDVATGGSVVFDTQTLSAQVAGETVAIADIVYLKESDQRWYKATASTVATFSQVQLGVARTAGNVSDTIQVSILGPVSVFSGLTAGSKYYLSDTAGAVSTTPGTYKVFIGTALTTSTILVNKGIYDLPTSSEKDALAGGGAFGTPSSTNKFLTQEFNLINLLGDGSDGDVTISSPTTLTRDMYYNNLVVNSTLTTDGYRIFVKDTISGNGTVIWGTPTAGSAGGSAAGNNAGGAGGSAGGSGNLKNVAGSAGGDGGSTGTNGVGGVAKTSVIVGNGSAGGDSGSGGTTTQRTGGAGGVATKTIPQIGTVFSYAALNIGLTSTGSTEFNLTAAGAGGGAGGDGGSGTGTPVYASGGGGGASGGIISIAAKVFSGTFTISAAGAAGGAAGSAAGSSGSIPVAGAGGGAGGAGGTIILFYNTKTWSGSTVVTGGAGGAGGAGYGSGSAGSAGTAGPAGIVIEFKGITKQ